MANKDCIDAILKVAPDLSREQAAAIDDIVAGYKRRRQQRGGAEDITAETIDFARRAGEDEVMAAMIERRDRLINIAVEKQALAFMGGGKASRRLSDMLTGSQRGYEGAARSADAEGKAIEAQLLGGLVSDLKKAGLLPSLRRSHLLGSVPVRDPALDADIANELARLTDPAFGRDTGNPIARDAAAIIHKYQEAARVLQNRAGAWIGKLEGWIVRQSHDMERIRRAGRESWKDFVRPLLDEKTFDGIENVESYLDQVWVNLATGNHLKADAVGSIKDMAFRGPGNRAKRLSAERSLFFKSADDWTAYNERFGTGDLMEAVAHGLGRAAQNTALMRKLGPNPQYMFERLRDKATLAAKEAGDEREVRDLNGWLLRAEFDEVAGFSNVPANPRLAHVASAIRIWNNLTTLGGVVLSSIPDVAVRAAALRHNGVGFLDRWGTTLDGFLAGYGSERREVADALGVGIDGVLSETFSRFAAADTAGGTLSKLQDTFFRLNLSTWWTNAMERGVGLVLANNLAKNVDRAFADLPELLRLNLGRYGIGEAEWTVVKQAAGRAADGRDYVTTDALRGLPDEAFAGLNRQEVETALQTYYVAESRDALTMPGAYERTLLRGATRRGTPHGEAIRFLSQLKTYPVTYLTRQFGREMLRRGAPDWYGLSSLIVTTTVLGYLAMAAKDIAKGRTPRDPSKPETFFAAMQQGGGLGIYGDFLFGEYNRFGGGLVSTVAGPTAGKVDQLASILTNLRDGQFDQAAATVRFARDMTPGINLFYSRLALDYLFLYQIQEALNPGYLRRMERRVEKENGAAFLWPPSRAIPYGGSDRLFEGVKG